MDERYAPGQLYHVIYMYLSDSSQPKNIVWVQSGPEFCTHSPRNIMRDKRDTGTVGPQSVHTRAATRTQHAHMHGPSASAHRAAPGPPRRTIWLQMARRWRPEMGCNANRVRGRRGRPPLAPPNTHGGVGGGEVREGGAPLCSVGMSEKGSVVMSAKLGRRGRDRPLRDRRRAQSATPRTMMDERQSTFALFPMACASGPVGGGCASCAARARSPPSVGS